MNRIREIYRPLTRYVLAVLLILVVSPACSDDEEAPVLDPQEICGNGVIEGDQVCDDQDLGGMSCEDLGYASGTLGCMSNCRAYDVSQCGTPESCGTGQIDDNEICDGEDLGGASCEDLGYGPGELACESNCLAFDISGCSTSDSCGSGQIDDGEVCDGEDLGGASCEDLGYGAGELACESNCLAFDTSGCGASDTCGSGQIDDGEVCDGQNLGGASCEDFGFTGGDLECLEDCSGFDTAACTTPSRFSSQWVQWSVPNLTDEPQDESSRSFDRINYQASSYRTWYTFDITGDGGAELVQTRNPENSSRPFGSPGDYHWRVYTHTGSGFDSSPIQWDLPDVTDGPQDESSYSFDRITYQSSSDRAWYTFDITGDGGAELVQTRNPENPSRPFGSPGDYHWRVYTHTGSGFDISPIQWDLPDVTDGPQDESSYSFDRITYQSSSDRAWYTFDITGNGAAELVQTRDPENSSRPFGSPGDYFWRVYPTEP